ncbi:MAG: oligopeptide/dipeptide ABC transporter ATP-binding protein [Egibacteraceae bacterium]
MNLVLTVGCRSPRRSQRTTPALDRRAARARVVELLGLIGVPDVTIQAQVVAVLRAAQRETGAVTILITHDLELIAELADHVVVLYGGRVVEVGDVFQTFGDPRHPYTLGLLSSLPRLDVDFERLSPIGGQSPSLIDLPPGCAFHPRCRLSAGRERFREVVPPLVKAGPGQQSACHFHAEIGIPETS